MDNFEVIEVRSEHVARDGLSHHMHAGTRNLVRRAVCKHSQLTSEAARQSSSLGSPDLLIHLFVGALTQSRPSSRGCERERG